MERAIQALTVFLPLGYFASAVLCGMAFAGEKEPAIGRGRPLVTRAVVLLHVVLLALHWVAAGALPVTGTWMLVSAIALATALVFALVAWRLPQPTVGTLVYALVGLLQLAASSFGPVGVVEDARPTTAFRLLHVSTSVVASAALILSGLYGALHILLYRQMKRRSFGPLFRGLPDLDLLARMTRRAALAGFLFLTVGLNVGIGMAHAQKVLDFHYRDPHVLLTLALWVHFGLIGFSRQIRLLTSRRASWAAAAGLVTLILVLLLTLVPSATFHALG